MVSLLVMMMIDDGKGIYNINTGGWTSSWGPCLAGGGGKCAVVSEVEEAMFGTGAVKTNT